MFFEDIEEENNNRVSISNHSVSISKRYANTDCKLKVSLDTSRKKSTLDLREGTKIWAIMELDIDEMKLLGNELLQLAAEAQDKA